SMRRSLAKNETIDSSDSLRFLPSLCYDLSRIRQLLSSYRKNLFSHELGNERPLGLIGHFVFGIHRRTFGQMPIDLLYQEIHSVSGASRYRNHFDEFPLDCVSLYQRKQFRLVGKRVDLVWKQKRTSRNALQHFKNKTVALAHRLDRIDHQQNQIHGRERIRDNRHHSAIQFIPRFVNARRVEKDYLTLRL